MTASRKACPDYRLIANRVLEAIVDIENQMSKLPQSRPSSSAAGDAKPDEPQKKSQPSSEHKKEGKKTKTDDFLKSDEKPKPKSKEAEAKKSKKSSIKVPPVADDGKSRTSAVEKKEKSEKLQKS